MNGIEVMRWASECCDSRGGSDVMPSKYEGESEDDDVRDQFFEEEKRWEGKSTTGYIQIISFLY